jgi:hypothetical protein
VTGIQRPAVKTVIKVDDLWNEFLLQWELFGDLHRGAIELLLAHVGAEVAIDAVKHTFPICYCFNIGNKRQRPEDDFCLYPCGEELPARTADELIANSAKYGKGSAVIALRYVKQVKQANGTIIPTAMASVRFNPPHPFCRFRAYKDLQSSAHSLINHAASRRKCWQALLTGDPAQYVRELAAIKYFTADESAYRKLVITRLAQVKRITDLYDWGDVS